MKSIKLTASNECNSHYLEQISSFVTIKCFIYLLVDQNVHKEAILVLFYQDIPIQNIIKDLIF